jgi:tocopherol O-methyltransferase
MIAAPCMISHETVAAHYDQLDRFYRSIWGDAMHHGLWQDGCETRAQAVRALHDAVIARARLRPGMQVCDVGCGYGHSARLMVREQDVQVTGINRCPAQHQRAQALNEGADQPHFLLGDWLESCLPAQAFDAVLAIESFEHIANKAAAIREALRVLRPGGSFVLAVQVAKPTPAAWQRRLLLQPICKEARMPSLGTTEDFSNWLSHAGFQMIEIESVSAQVSRTWPSLAAECLRALLRQPGLLRYVLDFRRGNPRLALTMLRLWLAHQTGAMDYLILSAQRPKHSIEAAQST